MQLFMVYIQSTKGMKKGLHLLARFASLEIRMRGNGGWNMEYGGWNMDYEIRKMEYGVLSGIKFTEFNAGGKIMRRSFGV